jgi:hypothetical protein
MTAPSTPPTSPPDDGPAESAAPETPSLMFSWMEDPDAAPEMPWTKDFRRRLAQLIAEQTAQPGTQQTAQPMQPGDGRDGSAAPATPSLMFSWMEDPDAALEMPWTKDVRRWLAEHLNRTLPHAQAQRPAEAETQQPAEAQTQQTLPPSAAPPTRT